MYARLAWVRVTSAEIAAEGRRFAYSGGISRPGRALAGGPFESRVCPSGQRRSRPYRRSEMFKGREFVL
jgi:hypothetical protein